MKIAYIYDAVYPWVKGGAEKRIYEMARRMVDRGHEVHWFGLKWWDGDKDILMEGINIHSIGKWDSLYVDGRRSIKEGLYFGMKTLTGLKGDFDVIDCQEFPYFSCFSAKIHSLLKSKLVITWHEVWGSYWYEYLGRKGVLGKVVEQMTAKLTDNNIAVSEKTKRDLKGMVKNVEVIPNGIDFDRIQRVKKSVESDLIFVGRLIKEKNVDVLIKAVKLIKEEMPDVSCFIIGDGPERKRLEKLICDFDVEDNIKLLGFLEIHDDVISFMKSSKVFILPSTREGFGIVTLEANACGLPIVTIDHERNAAKELIKEGTNGFLCGLKEEEISERIILALSERMGKKCVETSKGYDWSVIIENYDSFLKGIIVN